MTKIGIIGATGHAGQALVPASLKAGFEVTGIVRNKEKAHKLFGTDLPLIVKDALKLNSEDLKNFDVIIDSFATMPNLAEEHVELAKNLVSIAKTNNQRLIFILGAGSLLTGEDHHLNVEDISKTPGAENWINIPKQQLKELEYLRTVKDVDWVGISPANIFQPGPASDKILYGKDELLYNNKGESISTTGSMAKVIVDEIGNPKHHQTRFTIANG